MKSGKRQYKSERQVKRQSTILKTARSLVGKVGYDGLNMRGLAKEAHVSQMTLYNLYGSKDQLLLAALLNLLEEMVQSPNLVELKGFDYLLMHQDVMSEEIERSPGYADAMSRALFQSRPNDQLVSTLLEAPIRQANLHLLYEKKAGSIAEYVDVPYIAQHIVVQSWGVLLLWNKGLLNHDQVKTERRRSLLMMIIGICKGTRARRFKTMLMELNTS